MFVLMWKRWVAQLDDYSSVLQYKVFSCIKKFRSNFKSMKCILCEALEILKSFSLRLIRWFLSFIPLTVKIFYFGKR